MGALIAFFETTLGKAILQAIILLLQKSGAAGWAEAMALKFGAKAVEEIDKLKTYSKPEDFPPDGPSIRP